MNSTVTIQGLMPGVSPTAKITRSATAGVTLEATLNAAVTGTLSNRADNTNGILTLAANHGITDAEIVTIFWTDTDGVQQFAYGATVGTVANTSVPFTGAAGTVLPTANTAVSVDVEQEFNIDFDGDDLEQIIAVNNKTAAIQFVDAGDAVIDAVVRAANECYLYINGISATNPLTGNAVDAIRLANGDSNSDCTVKVGALYSANA